MNTSLQDRRSFLKLTAGAIASPFILPSSVWSAPIGPNDRITVGFIALGGMNSSSLKHVLGRQDTRVLAVCDIDAKRTALAKQNVDQQYNNTDCTTHDDFRELLTRKEIDAVYIAPPDHWHAAITLAALRAGKDVYCEKPLTHNIHEAIEVMKAVDTNRRVLQTGSMQRSMKEFRVACELVRNGVIGNIRNIVCSFGGPPKMACDLPDQPTPTGVDWNLWCGPAPLHSYNTKLLNKEWRPYKDYGSGGVGDWGAHHLDIAQWALGMDESGPVEVIHPEKPNADSGCRFIYANGVTLEHEMKGEQRHGFGVHFFGSNGEVKVNRGRFVLIVDGKSIADYSFDQPKPGEPPVQSNTSCAVEVQKAERAFLTNAKTRLYSSNNHHNDFFNCVRARTKPITNEMVGGHSAIACHLMNQSYFNQASFKWDPSRLTFAGGTGNPKWLTRDYRTPWVV